MVGMPEWLQVVERPGPVSYRVEFKDTSEGDMFGYDLQQLTDCLPNEIVDVDVHLIDKTTSDPPPEQCV